MSLQKKALQENTSVTCSRLKGVMQTEKRRCIQLETTGISLALVLNSSQMREVSYENEGFYFATTEYIVVTSHNSCKCHFASFCNFWGQDIQNQKPFSPVFICIFFVSDGKLSVHTFIACYLWAFPIWTENFHSTLLKTLHPLWCPSGQWNWVLPDGKGVCCSIRMRGSDRVLQKVWITRINQAVPEGFVMIWCTVLGLQQLIPLFLKKMRSPVLCREKNNICMRKLNGPRTVICPWGHLAWHGSHSCPSKTKRGLVLSLYHLNCAQALSWLVFDALNSTREPI